MKRIMKGRRIGAIATTFLLLLILLASNVQATAAASNPPAEKWLDDYDYCIEVRLTSVAVQTDFQIRLNITKGIGTSTATMIYLQGHSLAWPNDVRFMDGSGNPLSFWIEWNDANTGRWWINMPTLAISSSNKIFIFFGNAAAQSASDGKLTFPFYETWAAPIALPSNPVINGVADGTYNGPGTTIVKAANDELIVFNREGHSHAGAGDYGVVTIMRSQDNGITWTEGYWPGGARTLAIPGIDIRNYGAGVTSTGRIILLLSLYTGTSWNSLKWMTSDDNGYTWSDMHELEKMTCWTAGIGNRSMSAYSWGYNVITDGLGHVGVSYYGQDQYDVIHTAVYAWSADNGDTFPIGNQVRITSDTSGHLCTETNLVYLGSNTIMSFSRQTANDLYVHKSTDNGVTWTNIGTSGLNSGQVATASAQTYTNATGGDNAALVWCDFTGVGYIKGNSANSTALRAATNTAQVTAAFGSTFTIRTFNGHHVGMPCIAINGVYGFVVSYDDGANPYVTANILVDRWIIYDDTPWTSQAKGLWYEGGLQPGVMWEKADTNGDGQTSNDRMRLPYNNNGGIWMVKMKISNCTSTGGVTSYAAGIIIRATSTTAAAYDVGYYLSAYVQGPSATYYNKLRMAKSDGTNYVELDVADVTMSLSTWYTYEFAAIGSNLRQSVGNTTCNFATDATYSSGTQIKVYSTVQCQSQYDYIIRRNGALAEPTMTSLAPIAYGDWVDVVIQNFMFAGIFWTIIVFLVPLIMNGFLPKIGFVIGLSMMTIILVWTDTSFMFITLMSLIGSGLVMSRG